MKIKAVLSAVLACLMLCACGRKEIQLEASGVGSSNYDKEAPLMCIVESQEEAEAIAEQYGITLLECNHGVAVFYTEENPNEVIRRGMEQGWPELSLNQIRQSY